MTLNADDLGVDQVGAKVAADRTNNPKDANSSESRLAERGVDVALSYKGIDLRVEKIKQDENGLLEGVVAGFSNVCSMEYEGVRLGQKITFRYPHVQQSFEIQK